MCSKRLQADTLIRYDQFLSGMQLNRSNQLRAKESEESGTSIPSHSRRAIAVLVLIPRYFLDLVPFPSQYLLPFCFVLFLTELTNRTKTMPVLRKVTSSTLQRLLFLLRRIPSIKRLAQRYKIQKSKCSNKMAQLDEDYQTGNYVYMNSSIAIRERSLLFSFQFHSEGTIHSHSCAYEYP